MATFTDVTGVEFSGNANSPTLTITRRNMPPVELNLYGVVGASATYLAEQIETAISQFNDSLIAQDATPRLAALLSEPTVFDSTEASDRLIVTRAEWNRMVDLAELGEAARSRFAQRGDSHADVLAAIEKD